MNCSHPSLAPAAQHAAPDAALPAPLQALLDGLLDAALVIDATTRQVLGANPAAAACWGGPLPALHGQAVLDLLASPEDAAFWLATDPHGSDSTSEQTLHSDSLLRRHDGSLCQVERRVSRLRHCGLAQRPAWLVSLRDLGPQRRLEAELDRLTGELASSLDGSADAVLMLDQHGALRHCNRAFVQLWRLPETLLLSPDERGLHQHLSATLQQPDPTRPVSPATPLATDNVTGQPTRLTLRDGRTLERRVLAQYGRGELIGHLLVFRDISRELADQARLQLAAQVFEASQDAIFITDAQQRIVVVNRAGGRQTGRARTALAGLPLSELLTDPADPLALERHLAALPELGNWDGELSLRGRTASHPVGATLLGIRSTSGAPNGCIAVLRDRSEQLAQQNALRELACRDPLTGLPNRQRLNERLGHEILACEPRGDGLALLLIGLDRFIRLNDSLGPAVGDQVLIEVARRLSACVRPGDTVARLGGDTFAVLLQHASAEVAEQVARRMLAALAEEMAVNGLRFSLSASVGAALHPGDGRSVDDLVKNADSAMHRAKHRNGGELCFYQPQMNTGLLAHLQLDHAMRQALRRGDFRLHYQPQVDVGSGTIVGAEALLRWRDAELGEVSPGRFIPVAEDTGFITELGDWVLQQAVQQAATWRSQGLQVPIAVNVSALQFQQRGFVARVRSLLEASGLPADQLELELTESVLLGDINEIIVELGLLAALGVRLAIDDFGTGYCGLGYLKRLPIHRLKIDRCFISDLPDDASDAAIVRSVIEMAHALGLDVIAEGVETEAQRRFLADAGCPSYQGWLCAPALGPAEFAARAGLVEAQPQVA
ncbi:MAG: EAL domain-containing protein [Leptothrix sp. (in: b-proteobacteria)]